MNNLTKAPICAVSSYEVAQPMFSVFNEIPVDSVNAYLEVMDAYSSGSYVFRGQPNLPVLSQAFRPHEIDDMNSRFPGKKTNEWLDIKDTFHTLQYLPEIQKCRIIAAISFICQYNFWLLKYLNENPHQFIDSVVAQYKLPEGRSWSMDQAFTHTLNLARTLIGRVKDDDGSVINFSSYPHPLAYNSPFLPQHYGVQTAALDWSRNHNVSLHFALKSDTPCVFVCDKSSNNGFPVQFVEDDDATLINERMDKQEGLFAMIDDEIAILFYIINGIWPAIDDFVFKGTSSLKITKVIIDPSQKDTFRKYLDSIPINDKTLGLA